MQISEAARAQAGACWRPAAGQGKGCETDRAERAGTAPGSRSAQSPAAAEAAAVSATHVRKAGGAIELVTQDGDVVRIGLRSRQLERVVMAGTHDAGGSTLAARIVTEHNTRLKVEVRGELDAAELTAIEDFVDGVNALASEFYGGDAEAAFAAAAGLQADAQEIARYSVKLSVSERYEVRASLQRRAPPAYPAPPVVEARTVGQTVQPPSAGAPQPQPAAAGAQAGVAPRSDASAAPASPVSAPSGKSATVADARIVDGSPAEPASGAFASMHQFLQRVLAASDAPLRAYGVALEWGVRIELTAALIEAAKPDVQPHPGADLLANVLVGAANAAHNAAGPSLDVSA